MEALSPDEMPRHPYLSDPVLYVHSLQAHVSDEHIAKALEACVPFRPRLDRSPLGPTSGRIEFKTLMKVEKALATVAGKVIPGIIPPAFLNLEPTPPSTDQWPPPSARPRIVSNLPPNFTDSRLFDIFRTFGALAASRMQPRLGPDVAIIEFWREEDARRAEDVMHFSEVDDFNISVQVYHQPRKQEFNIAAPAFVPRVVYPAMSPPLSHTPLLYSPPRQALPFPRSPSIHNSPLMHSPSIHAASMPMPHPSPFMPGPGQQVQFAPQSGPGSTSTSGLIDPCNLFCKNLDQDIDSNALFAHFKQFGQIVSARVMRNESGQSRGFGFVSFQSPEQANRALSVMNGATIGQKQIVVRLHEPKQLRKEKLAARFNGGGRNGHPRTTSGATSPTLSEGGESLSGWPSHQPETRPRRGSGSYYHAALNGSLNLPMQYDNLSALSPVVRTEVLSGELSRRLKDYEGVEEDETNDIVAHLLNLSLDIIVRGLNDPRVFLQQVENAKSEIQAQRLGAPVINALNEPIALLPAASRSASTSSGLLDPSTLAATASAPEHPSTPVSFTPSVVTPPRTASPTGSIAPSGSEKERLFNAIQRIEPKHAADLTDMLLSLSKKERALCLFNVEYLRGKVEAAKTILLSLDDDPVPESGASLQDNVSTTSTLLSKPLDTIPETPARRAVPQATSPRTPQTPDLSYSRGPSVTASPPPPMTPIANVVSSPSSGSTATTVYTLATLAKLPAVEIVRIAGGNPVATTGLPLPKADLTVVAATDRFIDDLSGRAVASQKQAVGEKLFKVVKAFGVKNAPKVTIALLDSEDLRSLAHLMNSYPAVLKEKVLQQTASSTK